MCKDLTPSQAQPLRGGVIDFNVNEDLMPHPMDFVYRAAWDLRRWDKGTIGVRSVVYRGREMPLAAVQLVAVGVDGSASVLDFMSGEQARKFAQDVLEAIADAGLALAAAKALQQGGVA